MRLSILFLHLFPIALLGEPEQCDPTSDTGSLEVELPEIEDESTLSLLQRNAQKHSIKVASSKANAPATAYASSEKVVGESFESDLPYVSFVQSGTASSTRTKQEPPSIHTFPQPIPTLYTAADALMVTYGVLSVICLGFVAIFLATERGGKASKGGEAGKPLAIACSSERFLTVPQQTLQDFITDTDDIYLYAVDGRTPLTYKQLRVFIGSPNADVSRFGISLQDRLVTILGDGPETAVAFWAFTGQCVFAPLNQKATDEEIQRCLVDIPAKAVVIQKEHAGRIQSPWPLINCAFHPVVAGLFTLNAIENKVPKQTPMRSSIALLLMTSGTTKKPKLVPITHQSLIINALSVGDNIKLTPSDCSLHFLPLFHIGGLNYNIISTALSHGSTVCATHFSGPEAVEWIKKFRPTWYYGSPTIHILMMRDQSPIPGTIRAIRNAAAALLPAVAEEMRSFWECEILPAYGMSECGVISGHQVGRKVVLASSGPPAGPSLKIDPSGEIIVEGSSVFSGYEVKEGEEDVNATAWNGTWFKTGDCGYIDRSGYLFVTGRSKEIIIRGGENISPFEVEAAMNNPKVLEKMVFSVSHEELGEVVGLAVKTTVPDEDLGTLFRSLKENSKLDYRMMPEMIVKCAELPKGNVGKLKRIGMQQYLNLPKRSLSRPDPVAYVFVNGALVPVQVEIGQEEEQVDSLGLLKSSGGTAIPEEDKNVVMSLYCIAAFSVVVHHMVDPMIFPPLNRVADTLIGMMIGFVDGGVRMPMQIYSICASYLLCKEPFQGTRPLVLFLLYIMWGPWSRLMAWICNEVSGVNNGTLTGSYQTYASWYRWFLLLMVMQYCVFSIARKFPCPRLQCSVLFILEVVSCFWKLWPFGNNDSLLPSFTFFPFQHDQKIFENIGFGCMTVYWVTGWYGHDIVARCKKHPWAENPAIQSRLITFSAFFCFFAIFALQFWACKVDNDPNVMVRGSSDNFWIFYGKNWGNFALFFMDQIVSLALIACLSQAVRPVKDWLSPIGSCALGIYVATNMVSYNPVCMEKGDTNKCGVAGSPAVFIQGVPIIPDLQNLCDYLQDIWPLQVLVVIVYALGQIFLFGLPFQWVYMKVVGVFDRAVRKLPGFS